MATDLYEVLELSRDASPEQIRKAYKKKALLTHPDRIPNATPEQKTAAEEQFRKVNNAYEILNDPLKRQEYDMHGVWPPPEPEVAQDDYYSRPSGSRTRDYPHYYRQNPFNDSFFAHPQHHSFASFAFSDPFALFNSVFPDFPLPSRYGHHHRSTPTFFRDPFEEMHNAILNDMSVDLFEGMHSFNHQGFGFIEPGSMGASQGQWASESVTTTSVNGVTTTVRMRRDFDGNEHITKTYADGRKVHTVNGIEQASGSRGYLPQPSPARHSSQRSSHRQMSQGSRNYAPPVPQPAAPQSPYNNQRTDYSVPPPPYPGQYTSGYPAPPPNHFDHHHHHRPRRSSEKYPYPTDTSSGLSRHEDNLRHHKRRWWPGKA